MEKAEINKTKKEPGQVNQNGSKKKQKDSKRGKKSNKGQTPSNPQTLNNAKAVKSKSRRNRKQKGRERGWKTDGYNGDEIKLVMRLLPPDLTEEQFSEVLIAVTGPLSEHGVINWYYVKGCYPSKVYSEPLYSRCYLIFKNIEYLTNFSVKVEKIEFIDDKNNSSCATLRISPFLRKLQNKKNTDDKKNKMEEASGKTKGNEGMIQNDPLFKTFLNSLKALEKNGSEYSLENISIFKPIESELAKQDSLKTKIQSKAELAMTELTGKGNNKSTKSEKSKKKSKEGKKGKKSTKGAEVPEPETESIGEVKKKRKRTRKKKKGDKQSVESGSNANQQNVVILEAAGKKELRRRQKQKEGKVKTKLESLPRLTQEQQSVDIKSLKMKVLQKKEQMRST